MDGIKEEIGMTPEASELISQVIDDVHRKSLNDAFEEGKDEGRLKGKIEGKKEGIKEGIKEGRDETLKEVAKNLKDVLSPEEISQRTGLTVEKIMEL